MNNRRYSYQSVLIYTLPVLVMVVLLIYTYSKFFMHSYGFRWNSTGTIIFVFVEQPETGLKVGDQLVQIGDIGWEEYSADLRKTFFEGAQKGDVIPITVKRNGEIVTVQWTYPGFNTREFFDQFYSEWILAYFFWFAGTLSLLLLRPRDERWWLIFAFDFLTAIWLIAGSGNSAYHVLYSALILRTVIWFCVVVYLHLHWIFPYPLGKLPPFLLNLAYASAFGVAIVQWFQLIPSNLYFLGFLVAIAGSLILLIAHYFRQPEVRRDLGLMLNVAILAIAPSVLWGLFKAYVPEWVGSLSLLSLPLLPASYLLGAYRRQLGGFEIRVNRLISIYLFVILLGTITVPLIAVAFRLITSLNSLLLIAIIASSLSSVACLVVYPLFQDLIEKRLLGISLPPRYLQEIYSARITTSTSLASLLELLRDEVFPSLLIRQFMFLQLENGTPKTLLASGVTEEQHPSKDGLPNLEALPEKFPGHEDQSYPWARLILPLYLGEDLIGLWLLGRRDPDDIYSQAEIPLLQSLANQTAIALSNIVQTERLRKMYENDIERNEKSRLQLALDLHDSVLNQLAVLRLSVDDAHISPNFLSAYEEVTRRLREIVTDLRPPMLTYGLKSAIQELADNLMERSRDTVNIGIDLKTKDEVRYAENMEHHLYRIVQESCENAMRHGKSENITISGRLDPQVIQLVIEDDGSGFEVGENLNLESLLANKHFGLAGIMERANLIGAEFNINSAPGRGTKVRVVWKPDQLKDRA